MPCMLLPLRWPQMPTGPKTFTPSPHTLKEEHELCHLSAISSVKFQNLYSVTTRSLPKTTRCVWNRSHRNLEGFKTYHHNFHTQTFFLVNYHGVRMSTVVMEILSFLHRVGVSAFVPVGILPVAAGEGRCSPHLD